MSRHCWHNLKSVSDSNNCQQSEPVMNKNKLEVRERLKQTTEED